MVNECCDEKDEVRKMEFRILIYVESLSILAISLKDLYCRRSPDLLVVEAKEEVGKGWKAVKNCRKIDAEVVKPLYLAISSRFSFREYQM